MLRYLVTEIGSESGEWIEFITNTYHRKGDVVQNQRTGKKYKVQWVEGKAFNGKC